MGISTNYTLFSCKDGCGNNFQFVFHVINSISNGYSAKKKLTNIYGNYSLNSKLSTYFEINKAIRKITLCS